jgi:antitoxin component of MazEF toxin-antitoxin module
VPDLPPPVAAPDHAQPPELTPFIHESDGHLNGTVVTLYKRRCEMIKTLQKHGNSMALVIEKPMMEALGITEDTPLQLTLSGNALVITPANVGVGRKQIEESLKKMRRRYGPMLKRLAD